MNVTEQRLETKAAELEKQLDAANQRITELEKGIDILRGMVKEHYDTSLVYAERAEAAELNLATHRTDLCELKATANSIYSNQQKSTLTVAKDLLELIAVFVTEALAQIEQPQQRDSQEKAR